MSEKQVLPYGSWKSPITSDLIVADSIGLGKPFFDGSDIYWLEHRPAEGGRVVIVHYIAQGQNADMTPPPFNTRNRVHEYGGGSCAIVNGTIYFSNFSDQRLYRIDPGGTPQPISPEVDLRYADYVPDHRRGLLFGVREDHTAPGEAVNTLVKLKTYFDERGGEVIVSGNNFYSSPRLSPDGSRICWLTWNHPNMPWDGTELWVGDLDEGGAVIRMERVAGGPEESIFQPQWSPDGILYFVSDRTGWWNLYRLKNAAVESLCPMEAEFGLPYWVFGMSTYAFESARHIYCTYSNRGTSYLACLDTETLKLETIDTPYTSISNISAAQGHVMFTAGSPTEPTVIAHLDLSTSRLEVLRRSSENKINPRYISVPEEIEFPTIGGLTAYGFYYPPFNQDFDAPQGEKPPLMVMTHGGPTGATNSVFDAETQYWTSRGFAVLDVNYGGSTGYGRSYRQRLNGQWGVVDVDDCVNGAHYLVKRGEVDGNRLIIRGGSAGGYTTLCALTFRDVFKAGASYYGIGDLDVFVSDTHKFESRYLDNLVGPYPEKRDLYRERSAIYYTDRLSCALILFQGAEDKIVPPNQSRSMYAAVKAKGLPVAYLEFEGEQHGFRKAENIKRSLDAEFFFYSKVFGFTMADRVEPVDIDNL